MEIVRVKRWKTELDQAMKHFTGMVSDEEIQGENETQKKMLENEMNACVKILKRLEDQQNTFEFERSNIMRSVYYQEI